jgi:hypothetical protein
MMKISYARAYILAILAAAGMLAGCGGSQSMPTSSAAVNAVVIPEGHGHGTLAYIATFGSNGELEEFRFPKGKRLDYPITDSASGMCSRTDRGDFWATNSISSNVEEFRAGGTKVLKTLSVTAGDPAGCSINKSNDDLAVSLLTGGVVIYKNASGSGTSVSDGLYETFFVGYDGSGDLFADGFTSSDAVAIVEMPAGSSTFHSLTLPNTIEFPGIVQWDGTYVAVGDQEANAIYRYSVSGSTVTLEGTVTFSDASDCGGGDIFKGKYFLCPDAGDNNVKVYAYPAGGAPIDTWKGSVEPVAGIVIEE